MATQDVEGSISPVGDVVDFVIMLDEIEATITPFGSVIATSDQSLQQSFDGTVTPIGELIFTVPVECFPTAYDCVLSVTPEYECVGACDVPQLIPAQELILAGVIIPIGVLMDCPAAEPCPPFTVSDCNDVLRVAGDKILAWHIAGCGIILSTSGASGIVVHESFEYAHQSDMEAAGWTFIDEMQGGATGDGSINVGATDQVYDGAKSLKMIHTGTGTYPPSSRLRVTRNYGGADGLLPDTPYMVSIRGMMNTKDWFDASSRIYMVGTTTQNRSIGDQGIGAFQLLGPVQVYTTALAQLQIYLNRTYAYVTSNRQIWWDDLKIEGQSALGVDQWNDMSGRGNHLVRLNASVKPLDNGPVLNGVVTIAFPSGSYLEWPTSLLSEATALEAFVVIKSTSGSGLWRLGSDAADPTLFPDSVSGNILDNFMATERLDIGTPLVDLTSTFRLYHIRTDGSNINSLLDNLEQATNISHTFATSDTPVFGRSSATKPGVFAVAEVILAYELSAEERSGIIDMLNSRWALGLV